MGKQEVLEEEDGSLLVKQIMDDSSMIRGNVVEPELF